MENTNETDTVRAAMSILGSRTSARKAASSAANSRLSPATKPGRVLSEETRARMRAAQARRRAAEKNSRKSPNHRLTNTNG